MALFSNKKTKSASASDVYADLKNALASADVKFNTDDQAFTVYSVFQGDDLPIKVEISVDPKYPFLCFNSLLDFQAPEESYGAILEGLNAINAGLHFGAFILDPETGRVMYRYHYMFAEYRPSKDLIVGLTGMVVKTVDENDGNLKKLIPESTKFSDPMFGRSNNCNPCNRRNPCNRYNIAILLSSTGTSVGDDSSKMPGMRLQVRQLPDVGQAVAPQVPQMQGGHGLRPVPRQGVPQLPLREVRARFRQR